MEISLQDICVGGYSRGGFQDLRLLFVLLLCLRPIKPSCISFFLVLSWIVRTHFI